MCRNAPVCAADVAWILPCDGRENFRAQVMKTREIQRVGRFWLATTQRADGQWIAWAQTTPIYADAPLAESRERVWLASGFSREQATAKLKRELALPPYDAATERERRQCWHMLMVAVGIVILGIVAGQPVLSFAGIIGIGHGLYACALLTEESEDRRV